MKKLFIATILLMGTNAFSWTATYLGGNHWAITCANGTSSSYNGSSAGLDVVGPALCPGGLAVPNVPRGAKVEAGVSKKVNLDVLRNLKESNEETVQAVRTYPPHGYPCLGCHPCNDGSGDYCDDASAARVCQARPIYKSSDDRPIERPIDRPTDRGGR